MHERCLCFPSSESLREVKDGCFTLTNEKDCLASKDGREDKPHHFGPCNWCCGNHCTENGNKCEAQSFLAAYPDFEGKSRNGIGHDTCNKGMSIFARVAYSPVPAPLFSLLYYHINGRTEMVEQSPAALGY